MTNAGATGFTDTAYSEALTGTSGPPGEDGENLFADVYFHAAMQEMAAIGAQVRMQPHEGSVPYRVLSGRTGSRFFLLPERPVAVSASSLAMVQPLRLAPRVLKGFTAGAARLGLLGLLPLRRVHISGTGGAASIVGKQATHSAYLTGTASPHRKLVVQCMDRAGAIKGYAKVSQTPAVHALLKNEASIMRELAAIGLSTAVIPRVLLHEVRGDTAVLATDSIKTPPGHSPTRLNTLHLAFLNQLATQTASRWAKSGDDLLRQWGGQIALLSASLSTAWQERFRRVLAALSSSPQLIASQGLAHGDFIPVNMFCERHRLCVFDWEYAGADYAADNDLIHYLNSAMVMRGLAPAVRARLIENQLVDGLGRSAPAAQRRLLAHACVLALRFARRQAASPGTQTDWGDHGQSAGMLDALLERAAPP